HLTDESKKARSWYWFARHMPLWAIAAGCPQRSATATASLRVLVASPNLPRPLLRMRRGIKTRRNSTRIASDARTVAAAVRDSTPRAGAPCEHPPGPRRILRAAVDPG